MSQINQEKSLCYSTTIQNWRDAFSRVAVGLIWTANVTGLYVAKHPTGLKDEVTNFEATVLKQQQTGKKKSRSRP